jgi:hypothetical protein
MTTPEDLRHHIASSRERDHWNMRLKLAGIIVIILSAFGIVGRIDMEVEQAKVDTAAADHAAWRAWMNARELERGYRICPPDDAAVPSIMVIVIENVSDKRQLIKTCFRVLDAQRISQAAR